MKFLVCLLVMSSAVFAQETRESSLAEIMGALNSKSEGPYLPSEAYLNSLKAYNDAMEAARIPECPVHPAIVNMMLQELPGGRESMDQFLDSECDKVLLQSPDMAGCHFSGNQQVITCPDGVFDRVNIVNDAERARRNSRNLIGNPQPCVADANSSSVILCDGDVYQKAAGIHSESRDSGKDIAPSVCIDCKRSSTTTEQ